jgi:AcrR family transcriptional regulator
MKKRLSRADRHRSIVEAAADVFADQGFDGATTKQIAAAAKVSPALLYEHFPSKEALYRAVLRKLVRDQDSLVASLGIPAVTVDDQSNGAAAILRMLQGYFSACILRSGEERDVTAHRLMLASLASDGTYARLLYRRVMRRNLHTLAQAMDQARQAGEIAGEPLPAQSAFCFIEHVGSMLLSTHLGEVPIARYAEAGEKLVRQATLFCGRGLGLTADALARTCP